MPFRLKTAPTSEPVTLAEAKAHLRVVDAASDMLITALITAARQHVETYTNRALLEQVWELYLDAFPDEIVLPRPPLLSVASIKYLDAEGTQQTLASAGYKLDAISEPAEIVPAYGQDWPAPRAERNAVVVEYLAGFGTTAAAVPQPIKQAMLLLIGELYERREAAFVGSIAEIPIGAAALLAPYRIIQL